MKIVNKILIVVLAVLIFVSMICAFFAERINRAVTDYRELTDKIADEEYNTIVYDEVYASLNEHMSLIVIRPEDLSGILTREAVTAEAHIALQSVLDSMFTGKTTAWSYKNEELRSLISSLLAEYAKEADIEYVEGSDDSVYELICETITNELKVMPDLYSQKLAPYVIKLGKMTSYWYIFAGICIVCAAAIIFIQKRELKNALYNIALPSYLGAFSTLAVTYIVYSRDYLSFPVLNNPSLRYMIRKMYNVILYDMRNAAIVMTVCFAVIAVAVIIVMSVQKNKVNKSKTQKNIS